jgi:hypothetical protein
MAAPVATCVLFAAGFDWLEALLPVAFVLFWIVSQIIAVIRRVQGGNGRGNAPRPQPLPRIEPPRGPAQPVPEGADWRGELERQIAEFLRESQGQPAAQAREKPAPRTADSGPRRDDTAQGRGREKSRSQRSVTNKPAAERQTTRQTVRPAAVPARPATATATTGAGVEPAKGDVTRHVQEAFPRSLSHLEGGLVHDAPPMIGDPATRPTATAADDLVKMLRNPATIRQVIIMREVLDRPVDRW